MNKIYIYGYGYRGKLLLDIMQTYKEVQVDGVIDIDEKKHGRIQDGLECISIQTATDRGAKQSMILVTVKEAIDGLVQSGFQYVIDFTYLMHCIPKRYYAEYLPTPFYHYESPFPELDELDQKESNFHNTNIREIFFNDERQMEILECMKAVKAPVWETGRYLADNVWFGSGSAAALYYMMHILKPKTIIEVGSGFSTSVMLDVNEQSFDNSIQLISIEPYPQRLKSLLQEGDKITIHEKKLQEMELSFFDLLGEQDILFIDSSHVSHFDSDINYIFFEILPRLKPGVYIHFHDIFWPFEYPRRWIQEGRTYNELYLLRAFLMDNSRYTIQWFGGYMSKKYADRLGKELQGCGNDSLWIKKE